MPWHTSYYQHEPYSDRDDESDRPSPFDVTHHQYRHPGRAAIAGELYVAHSPPGGHFRVRLGHTDDGGRHHIASLIHDEYGTSIRRNSESSRHLTVAPPSETLRALVANHGETDAWAPLLDRLAEEYPEHFNSLVDAHTAARAAP